MKYRFALPTFDDVYLHLMVLLLLFFAMGDYTVIIGNEFLGKGFVFTKENVKYLVPLTIFCLMFFAYIYRAYKSFRPWIFVYAFILFIVRFFFF